MTIKIPNLSIVFLIGASGSGKSTFAGRHFKDTEVLSSDAFRRLVADSETVLDANEDAFDALRTVAAKRLKRGLLTVVDATNVQPHARKPLLALAREYHAIPVAIVLNVPESVCHERNAAREGRDFGPHVVRNHRKALRRSFKGLRREGFRYVYELKTPEDVDAVEVIRTPLWSNKRHEHGPFDVIGDVHGCMDELAELLESLGYVTEAVTPDAEPHAAALYRHPDGRRAVFVGEAPGDEVVDGLTATTHRQAVGLVEAGLEQAVQEGCGEHLVEARGAGESPPVRHGLGLRRVAAAAGPRALSVAADEPVVVGVPVQGHLGDTAFHRHLPTGVAGLAGLGEDLDDAVGGLGPIKGGRRRALQNLHALDGLGVDVVQPRRTTGVAFVHVVAYADPVDVDDGALPRSWRWAPPGAAPGPPRPPCYPGDGAPWPDPLR